MLNYKKVFCFARRSVVLFHFVARFLSRLFEVLLSLFEPTKHLKHQPNITF
jgi:hypothetical protein